jgi:hypothetical protein
MFVDSTQANPDFTDLDAMWFTLTLQNDGSFAYVMQQGPLGNAAGLIERTGDLPKDNMCKDVNAFQPDALTPPDENGTQFRCAETQSYLDQFTFLPAPCADPEYFHIVEGLSACCGGGFTLCENFCLDNSAFQPEVLFEIDGDVVACSYGQEFVDTLFPLNQEDACTDPEYTRLVSAASSCCSGGALICE